LEKSFGIAAGQAARQQFEPMLAYLRKQAELQKAFNARAEAKRRRVGAGAEEPASRTSGNTQGEATPSTASAAASAAPAAAATATPVAPPGQEAADLEEGLRIIDEMRKGRLPKAEA
jgi:hypothetical protein